MMEMVQRAALLNLEGATHLEANDDQQALASFNNALDCMSLAASSFYCTKLLEQVAAASTLSTVLNLTAVAQPQLIRPVNNDIPLMAIPKPILDPTANPDLMTISYAADEDSAEKNPQHFLYRQGLVFHPDVARTPVDSLFYSAVVIFNTALCFHQENETVAMNKASSLYDICLELLKESATRFNCAHIIVSAMNNKACLHHSLGDYDNANQTLDQLLSVIVSSTGASQSFSRQDMEGILHNILLLKTSCISPAA